MTLALDTNVLVHAHREDAARHAVARRALLRLLEGPKTLALPLPCVYEFLRIVTHPRIFQTPTPLDQALDALDALLEAEAVWLLLPGSRHPSILREVLHAARATGNLVHDAHIVALLQEHGIGEILTEDRDFGRFPGLRVLRLDQV